MFKSDRWLSDLVQESESIWEDKREKALIHFIFHAAEQWSRSAIKGMYTVYVYTYTHRQQVAHR